MVVGCYLLVVALLLCCLLVVVGFVAAPVLNMHDSQATTFGSSFFNK